MADGFIVRKGGAKQALAPTITEISSTTTSVTFTITNNDTEAAVILYEIGDNTPDANSLELATLTASSNITIGSLSMPVNIYATANVTGKVKSNVAELLITGPVYTAATGGTTQEYNSGGERYKSHTFTSSGTFEVTTVGNGDRNEVDYLIIAGGASGGGPPNINSAGGGGAGGFRTTLGTQGGLGTLDSKFTVTATSYGVTIGAGGSGRNNNSRGVSGVASSVFGISSVLGGGGGSFSGSGGTPNGNSGGSGGGAAGGRNPGATGGAGTTDQGFAGGNGTNQGGSAGGGGAGAVGVAGSSTAGSNGGVGLANLLRTGSNETRAGGGGGGGSASGGGTGGSGGGGNGGGSNGSTSPTSASANTGSGGGGCSNNFSAVTTSGAGGSGIVVIRYEIAPSV